MHNCQIELQMPLAGIRFRYAAAGMSRTTLGIAEVGIFEKLLPGGNAD
jgi:hypothetical protein